MGQHANVCPFGSEVKQMNICDCFHGRSSCGTARPTSQSQVLVEYGGPQDCFG